MAVRSGAGEEGDRVARRLLDMKKRWERSEMEGLEAEKCDFMSAGSKEGRREAEVRGRGVV